MNLERFLKTQEDFARVVNFENNEFVTLDFSANNKALINLDLSNTATFTDFVFNEITKKNAKAGIGGYLENRVIYRRSEHFQEESDARCIHLGVDIWAEVDTEIFAPLAGKVHSFANNNNLGDYGPTIILEHSYPAGFFYTLYGHLTTDSLEGLFEGKIIEKGKKLAKIGDFPINGDWPPHLHFQLMTTMLDKKGDFPGVCTLADKDYFASICPDPNLILRVKENSFT